MTRVLVVEDEMVVQLHLTRIVAELGHEIVGTAMNAREALEVAEHEAPELVLMDIHLADGDDGVETARELVQRLDCAVLFVTAFADQKTIARTAALGASGYLVKPFTEPSVRAAITTATASHGLLRRARRDAKQLASILDNIDALFVLDPEGRIAFANPRAAELTGWSREEAEGRALLDVLCLPVETERRRLEEALGQTRATRAKTGWTRLSLRGRDGVEHTVDLEIEAFHDGEDGDAPEASGVMVSLLERSRAARARAPAGTTKEARGFGAGTRILVYSHDTFGLGHLRRCLALIRTLCARHPGLSALLVTGSPLVHRYAMPPGADYVKLPALRKVEAEQYEARTLNVSRSTIRSMRSNLILHTLRDYDPNVLLVDHSPTGSRGELLPTLEWLAERGDCTRILGLRDIIDEPAAVVAQWEAAGVYDVLREHYEHVVVYGNRDVYDPVTRYRFPPEVAAKTRFVNYVCDPAATAPDQGEEGGEPGRPVVAVSIGGGDGASDTLLVPFLEMMRRFGSRLDFRAEILPGPLVPAEVESRLRTLAEGLPVTLRPFVPSTAALFRRAELVVATAGYNTCADILQNARRAILVPRVLYRHEQLIRARRLEELGLVTCIHPDRATPEALLEAIRRALGDEPLTRARAEGRVFLDGAERFQELCSELLVGVRAGSESP